MTMRHQIEVDEMTQYSEDQIETIYARNKTKACKDEQGNDVEYEQVVIKLRHLEDEVNMI